MSRRVPPSPHVPQPLGRARRERLAAADERSAAGYDALEASAEEVIALTRKLREEDITVSLGPDEDSQVGKLPEKP
jgi:hypothetical protein